MPFVVIELVCIVDAVINLALTLMVEIDAAFIRLANPVVKLAVTDERLDVKIELVCIVDAVINLALTLMVEIDSAFIRLANPVLKLAVTDERLDVKTDPHG
jgi:hypothetical protein